MQREGVPSRKKWLLSANRSQRSAAWMQSTASYASSMGVCTTPITQWSVMSLRSPTKAFTGKGTQCDPSNRSAPRKQNNSYVKIEKLNKWNKKPKRMKKKCKHNHAIDSKDSDSS